MAITDIKGLISQLPTTPGVYIYKNHQGKVLYVGKSRSLKDRVSSYLHTSNLEPTKQAMVQEIMDLEYVVTDTEAEALLLESTYIKKYRPPYNVILRDDKRIVPQRSKKLTQYLGLPGVLRHTIHLSL